jgi:ubiquinone/menaquinone biosynthesis C-methylase UbiE
VAGAKNVCAGPFGAAYDFYIEHERLSAPIGKLVWGIDSRPLYASFGTIGEVPAGGTIVDAPCGGGVAFRGLRPDQDVRYLAADLSIDMVGRARRRAEQRGLDQIEVAQADICALPFEDATADLFLSYSGLHCVHDPERAIREAARCLKPGGRLVGTTFLTGGTRRKRLLFEMGRRQGHPMPTFNAAQLRGWLTAAGITDLEIGSGAFVLFQGRKS